MAGLNFQTQTIINSNLDPDSGKGVKLFQAANGVLRIKRDFDFYKDKEGYGKVCAIRKRAGYNAVLWKAEVDFANLVSAYYNIPNNVPSCTGADKSVVLGKFSYP